MASVTFTLNGRTVEINSSSPAETLLDALRERGLTGAKEGCAEGECGACTVMLVAESHGRTAYRAINSCLMLLPMAAGHDIYTVESLAANGELAPAQAAMAAAGGSQCGYCTPGFVMSLVAEQYRPDRVGPCSTLALAGNLCRCTGYRPIRDAAESLGPPPQGQLLDRLAFPAPRLGEVPVGHLSRPQSVEDCLKVLASQPEARIVAGASDLGVESNLHGRWFAHLVSVEAIEELRQFTRTTEGIRIGAALTLTEIGELWSDAPAAFNEWLMLFASPPIRNRATLGGNLVTASPIGDSAPLLMAMDATVEIASANGRRVVALDQFFIGYRKTALRPGELLVSISIPQLLPQHLRFYKIAKRKLDDISTVAAAMAIDLDADRRITRARFCFGGVAATPLRAVSAERALVGARWDELAVERIQDQLRQTLSPLSDHRGSREYRLAVSASLVGKFYWESLGGR